MGVDIFLGSALTISGLILEAVTLGSSTIPSLIISGLGIGVVATLPLSMKITDVYNSKTRNFQHLCDSKLNKVMLIFTKALEDNFISDEEFQLVMNVKQEYRDAKMKLKIKSEKQIEGMFIENGKYTQNFSDVFDIEKLKSEIEKNSKKEIKNEVKKDLIEKRKEELKLKLGY